MLHPDVELRLIDQRVGHGLFARKPLPRGTIVWVRDDLDQSIPLSRASGLPVETRRVLEHFAYVDRFGDLVLCWDNGRYMNHSCEPNCGQPGYEFEIAIRDIAAGEQLVEDYGLNNMDCPWTCLCGAASCRGRIRHDDFATQADRWDARVAEAFPSVGRVEQLLWNRVREQDHVRAVLDGRAAVPSCRVHWRRDVSQLLASLFNDVFPTEPSILRAV